MRKSISIIYNINKLKEKNYAFMSINLEKSCDKVRFPFLIQNYLVNHEMIETSNMTKQLVSQIKDLIHFTH